MQLHGILCETTKYTYLVQGRLAFVDKYPKLMLRLNYLSIAFQACFVSTPITVKLIRLPESEVSQMHVHKF